MREIKFRAWDSEAETMFYSEYPIDLNFFEFSGNSLKAWRVVEAPSTIHEPPYPTPEELDNIMQYTGLKDKNGKEIYEGDVVRRTHNDGNDYNDVIKFGDIGWNPFVDDMLDGADSCYFEIIGNIYENPELLKE